MSKYLITIFFTIFSITYARSNAYFSDMYIHSKTCFSVECTHPNIFDPPDYLVTIKSNKGSSWSYNAECLEKDKTGKYIYITFIDNNKIQIVKSSDFGLTWSIFKLPSKKIREHLFNSPKIITNDSGQFVYLSWYNIRHRQETLQIAISSDFGETWSFPENTPMLFSSNLSKEKSKIYGLEMVTSESGQYVYVLGLVEKDNKNLLQIAMSHDFGKSWKYPNDCNEKISPYLFSTIDFKHMTTDSTGQQISIIFNKFYKISEFPFIEESSKEIFSSNFGETWEIQ